MLKYQELAKQLLREIVEGSYPEGKLPSMQKLAAEYSVSLQTAQSAIKSLEKQGVVTCMPGNAGTRINRSRAEMFKQPNRSPYDHGLPTERVVLRFVYAENLLDHVMAKIVESFEKRYPWIELELIPDRDLLRMLENGGEADVVMVNGRDIPYLARKGFLRELPENYPYLGNVNNGSYFQRHCYGVAIAWTIPILRFGRDLSPFADTRNMGKTITAICRASGSENIRMGIGFYSLMHYFLGDLNGNRLLNSDDDPMIRKAIEIFACFFRGNHSGQYSWQNKDFKENSRSVKFEYITSMGKTGEDYNAYDYNIVFADTRTVPLTAISLGITSGARHPQESYLWCNFLLQEEIQKEFSEVCGFLSPLRSVYRECCPEKLRSQLDAALLQAVSVGMSSRGLFMFYSSIYPLLEEYFEEKRSLDSAVVEIRKIFNEVNYAQTHF